MRRINRKNQVKQNKKTNKVTNDRAKLAIKYLPQSVLNFILKHEDKLVKLSDKINSVIKLFKSKFNKVNGFATTQFVSIRDTYNSLTLKVKSITVRV